MAILFAGSGCARGISEKEPENDIRKQAQLLESGQKLSGTFYHETGTDIDFVYVSIDSPAMISGGISAVKGIDSEILLFRKGEADPYKTINDNRGSLEESFGPLYIEAPGVVMALKPASPPAVDGDALRQLRYEFTVRLDSPPENPEREANDTPEAANRLGNSVQGFFNNAFQNGDVEKDFYFIEFSDAKKYRVGARLSEVAGVDSVLRMYTESGELLHTADSGLTGEAESIYSYGFDGPGRLYFVVNAKDMKTSEIPYGLTAEITEYDKRFELEPNDQIGRATSISTDSITGDFSDRSDVDFYRYFNGSFEEKVLRMEVAPGGDDDLILDIYQSAGGKPVTIDDSGSGKTEGLSNYFMKPLETVYIRVYRKNPRGAASYGIVMNAGKHEPGFEKEPNNNTKQANSVLPDKPISGYISPREDVDFFKVKMPTQSRMRVQLEVPDFCQGTLSVLDSRGIKTDGQSAAARGEKLELKTILDPNGYVVVGCVETESAVLSGAYSLLIQGEN